MNNFCGDKKIQQKAGTWITYKAQAFRF